jgi:SAM-dependent methyltransferase
MAVVQREDGRSTHIDRNGRKVHGHWYLDLDLFHKGFARASDAGGWMHIDRSGRPIYNRRFTAVEPFYNGQARVERLDGGLEVIDETGHALVELRPALRSEFHALSADLVGLWRTETIAAAVQLGVFESLPAAESALAEACGLPQDKACRLLRALQELCLVEQCGGGTWGATGRGSFLRKDHPLTLADATAEYAGPLRERWRKLPEALKAPGWRPRDVFAEVANDTRRAEPHHRMLRSYAHNDYRAVVPLLGLRGNERIVDAGGGTGALADLILQAHPGAKVTVLDRPEVVAQIRTGNNEGRLAAQAADIFGSWGVTADVVILARVLHDWDDDLAGKILANARVSLDPGGRLLVVEMVLDDEHGAGGLCDLHLLCVTGGRERTVAEFEELLNLAGFELAEVRCGATLPSVLVGRLR